jgi:hypothetical protein
MYIDVYCIHISVCVFILEAPRPSLRNLAWKSCLEPKQEETSRRAGALSCVTLLSEPSRNYKSEFQHHGILYETLLRNLVSEPKQEGILWGAKTPWQGRRTGFRAGALSCLTLFKVAF